MLLDRRCRQGRQDMPVVVNDGDAWLAFLMLMTRLADAIAALLCSLGRYDGTFLALPTAEAGPSQGPLIKGTTAYAQ